MAKKWRIPFKYLPGSWGLRGKTLERARAEYELSGSDLEIKLAEIEHGIDSVQVKKKRIEVDPNLDLYDKSKKLIDLEYVDDGEKKKLALLDVEFNHHKISDNEYNKQKATINREPWVSVISIKINKENPSQTGEYELDWNDIFVEELRKNGYQAPSDYLVVEKWFNMLCSAIAAENGIVSPTDKLPTTRGDDDDLGDGKKAYY